jgi:hypothetical protein
MQITSVSMIDSMIEFVKDRTIRALAHRAKNEDELSMVPGEADVGFQID